MDDAIRNAIAEHERKYHNVVPPPFPPTPEPAPEPEPTPTPTPGTGPSGIAVPSVKAGWKRVGFSHFDDDIPWGSWSGDKQGAMMGRASGIDTSRRGQYSNGEISQHDSLLDSRMRQRSDGQRVMGCPMNKAPNPTNNSGTAPRSIRVTECMKVDGPEAGWKIAHMVAKYGVVRPQEIDWPENPFGPAPVQPSAWLHLLDGGAGKHYRGFDSLYNWHTYTIEFMSGKYVQVEQDGKVVARYTSHIGTEPVHWIIQNETISDASKPIPDKMGEAHVLIDWVTIDVPA